MKKWFLCPYCKKKLIRYDKDAKSKGIFLLCKKCEGIFLLCKKCGKEIEIRINK